MYDQNHPVHNFSHEILNKKLNILYANQQYVNNKYKQLYYD